MAPRSAKTKKTAEVKVDTEATKKGRGKAKSVEEPEILEVEEKKIVEKKKRGKKPIEVNESEEINDDVPIVKKGRKKNDALTNGSEKEDSPTPFEEKVHNGNGDIAEENGDSESNNDAKGKKKSAKKDVNEPKTGRSRKNVKQTVDAEAEEKESVDEKPKSNGKGRGRKANQKVDKADNNFDNVEIEAPTITTKSRKKTPAKVLDEKLPESKIDSEDSNEEVEEPPKKKGKKNAKKEDTAPKKKATKKDDKGKGDTNEGDAEEEVTEMKVGKAKRGKKKPQESKEENDGESKDTGEPSSKRRRKVADEEAPVDDKKKAPLKNKSSTNYDSIDFTNNSKTTSGKEWNFKIASWNVDGIRAWLNKGGLDYIKYEKPDILCLQETKCSQDKLPSEVANLPGYHAYWLCSDKDGYAGVGIYTTKLAMNVQYGLQNEELDTEGRIITAEYEEFYLICTYVPNAGRQLVTLPKRLQWNEEFLRHVKALDKKKPVIICGDLNVAHNEIDLTNPKTNKKNAGFTEEERAGMTDLLKEGFVDTYRNLNPEKTGSYTFWTYMMNCRAKNVGWRLDYFVVSERLLPSICDSVIRSEVYGSDHCPISLFLHLTSAEKPKE